VPVFQRLSSHRNLSVLPLSSPRSSYLRAIHFHLNYYTTYNVSVLASFWFDFARSRTGQAAAIASKSSELQDTNYWSHAFEVVRYHYQTRLTSINTLQILFPRVKNNRERIFASVTAKDYETNIIPNAFRALGRDNLNLTIAKISALVSHQCLIRPEQLLQNSFRRHILSAVDQVTLFDRLQNLLLR